MMEETRMHHYMAKPNELKWGNQEKMVIQGEEKVLFYENNGLE